MSRYRWLASQWNKIPFTKPIHPVRASPTRCWLDCLLRPRTQRPARSCPISHSANGLLRCGLTTFKTPRPQKYGQARRSLHRRQRTGTCPDRPLWNAGPRACAVTAAIRQRVGLHVSQVYRVGSRLRIAPGVHHAALTAAKCSVRLFPHHPSNSSRAISHSASSGSHKSSGGLKSQSSGPPCSASPPADTTTCRVRYPCSSYSKK